MNCRSPKNSQLRPLAAVARRSCTKARNGATPVPGPTMMMSRSGAGSAKCRFGRSFTRSAVAALQPLGDLVRRNALAGAAVALVAHRRNQQMRLLADVAARRRDRIGARRERSRHRAQMLGGERDREIGDEIDQLPPGDPVARRAAFDQRLDVLVAGRRGIGLQVLKRQRVDVARFDKLGAQRLIVRQVLRAWSRSSTSAGSFSG